MTVVGVVPARLASSRFPRKPLALLRGMPMVGHCYHRTRLALGAERTWVTTCDPEIADYVRSIGGQVVMTAATHTRATARVAEAVEIIEAGMGLRTDAVVMVQGDEPLIAPDDIARALAALSDAAADIVNLMCRLTTREAFTDRNNVKVVVDYQNHALYFSREPIPSAWGNTEHAPRYMQTGIIAFGRDALARFVSTPETTLEVAESVDMNRVLETGGRIRMVPIHVGSIGVDTPDDLARAEVMMAADPVLSRYLQVGD